MFLFLKKTQAKKKTPKPTAAVLGISQFLHMHNAAKVSVYQSPQCTPHRNGKAAPGSWMAPTAMCCAM